MWFWEGRRLAFFRSAYRPPLETGDHLDQATFHAPYAAMQPDFRAELIGGVVFIPSPLRSEHGESYALVMGWVTYYWDVTPGVPVSRRSPPLNKGRVNTVTAGAKRRAVRAVMAGTSASLGSSKSPSKVPL